jgi:hypothetical protein
MKPAARIGMKMRFIESAAARMEEVKYFDSPKHTITTSVCTKSAYVSIRQQTSEWR